MTEHDRRILGPKNKPADDREALAEFARTHRWCQACGRDDAVFGGRLTIHHIIGGRGGRSDEPANLLYLCWEPCHMLAEGLDVRMLGARNQLVVDRELPLLPKITLGIALAMKIRAGELQRPILLNHPGSVEVVTSPEWERLTALHGRTLPTPEPIPSFFADLFKRNRPELHGCRE